MIDYLIHFYRKGAKPFQSLSGLPDNQALAIMKDLYVKGSIFWERFKDPQGYLYYRKQIEQKLRNGFIEKGGLPKDRYPIYFVLGRPKWTLEAADPATLATTQEIIVPLSALDQNCISFTYPDSMVSALLEAEKNPEYYEPEYHGKVFTLQEITELIERKGLPGEGWETRMPKHFAHYIEAQVWDHQALLDFLKTCVNDPEFDLISRQGMYLEQQRLAVEREDIAHAELGHAQDPCTGSQKDRQGRDALGLCVQNEMIR